MKRVYLSVEGVSPCDRVFFGGRIEMALERRGFDARFEWSGGDVPGQIEKKKVTVNAGGEYHLIESVMRASLADTYLRDFETVSKRPVVVQAKAA